MMKILGMTTEQFYTLLLLLLVVILGIVSFQFYFNVSGKNGLRAETGVGLSILSGQQGRQ